TTAIRCRTISSPIGALTLAGDGDVLTGLTMENQSHPPVDQAAWVEDARVLPDVVAQLDAYFAGELTDFDVPLTFDGTPFQRKVWSALLEIPYGTTESYGALAARIGQPSASRAVGLANGRNPIAIIVPCHRVIGSTGSL